MTEEEREKRIAQAIKFIKRYKKNVRFLRMRLKLQKEPGYNPWKKPLKERQYKQFDVDVEMAKLERAKAILYSL